MPNRILREGIITSKRVNSLDFPSEIFYRRLHSVADDYGRYWADDEMLKSYLYARKPDVRSTDISRWKAECLKAGLLVQYAANGDAYLVVLRFRQKVRSSSKFPEPSAVDLQMIADAEQVLANDEHLPSNDSLGVSGGVFESGGECVTRTREGAIPNISEVKAAAKGMELPESEAEGFWNHYQAQGWVTGSGMPVTSWTSLLHRWKARWERDGASGRANGAAINSAKAGIKNAMDAERVIKECQEEMRKITQDKANRVQDGTGIVSNWPYTEEAKARFDSLKTKVEGAKAFIRELKR